MTDYTLVLGKTTMIVSKPDYLKLDAFKKYLKIKFGLYTSLKKIK